MRNLPLDRGERMVQWSRAGRTSRLDHDALRPPAAPVRCGRAGLTLAEWTRRAARADHDSVTIELPHTAARHAVARTAAGHVMRAQLCSIIELRDGKVWRQEQYDCYE